MPSITDAVAFEFGKKQASIKQAAQDSEKRAKERAGGTMDPDRKNKTEKLLLTNNREKMKV